MYNKLYDNCFKTELNTKILNVEEENGMYWHACKDTIFYKESGGMGDDVGMMDNHLVQALKLKDGYIWHLLDVKLEGSVFMSINLHQRFHKCQVHTAQHLISAVLSNVYKVHTLSHHSTDDGNDVEFDFPDFNDKMAFELEVLCNGLIRDDLEVSVLYPTRAEAMQHLSQNEVMRDNLRVVRIGALDYNLCGCMHVPSLRYLQMLFIQGFEKTTNGYKIKYIVGDQLLDCTRRRYKVLDETSKSLAVSHLYVNTGVHRLLNETRQVNRDIIVWKQKYYEMLGKELAEEKEDVIVRFFDDIDEKSEAQLADYICTNYKKAVILIAKIYDNVHVVIQTHEEVNFPVEKVFNKMKEEYRIKGSIHGNKAQGGGLFREEILKFSQTQSKI